MHAPQSSALATADLPAHAVAAEPQDFAADRELLAREAAHENRQRRQATNRANAQHSTGPRTPEGKQRSAANSFKHGLYSKAVVTSDEDPAEFEALRESLRSEHQPANTTEDILVNELAEHFWRLRRMRALEAWAWDLAGNGNHLNIKLIETIQRTMGAAERGFHRALTALAKLQKARGFVPTKTEPTVTPEETVPETDGFVPSNESPDPLTHPHLASFGATSEPIGVPLEPAATQNSLQNME
jgi:hypothetical protein